MVDQLIIGVQKFGNIYITHIFTLERPRAISSRLPSLNRLSDRENAAMDQ